MNGEPLVSVVMAVYNGEAHLEEAVESILGQTFRDLEFVIVDDGSSDRTPALLARYAEADDRVHVHRQSRGGLVASLNRGCELARGRYLARMDADDVAFPDRLRRQVDFLEARPAVALVGAAYVLIDGRGTPSTTLYKPSWPAEIARTFSQYANPFLHPSVVMRSEVFREVGGYRSAYLHAEDYDLWLRIAEHHETANLSEPLLSYRVHHDQVSHRNLRQGIVSVLGSQASARERRAGGGEPAWKGPHVTWEDLRERGVAEAELEKTLAEACFWQANLMLLCGYADTARALYDEAQRYAGSPRLRRRLGRALFARYAEAHGRPGGPLRRLRLELLLAAVAFAMGIGLGVELLRGKLSRIPALRSPSRAD